jgi:hypothetical protein
MRELEYADQALLADYPGTDLSEEDKRAIADSTAGVVEILTSPELIIHGLGESLSVIVTAIFAKVEEVAGAETALEVARRLGREHGERNYSRFLANRGLPGGPRSFCEYEDYGHALRGPRHVKALFARYDETSVYVEREDCLYFCGERGRRNLYIEALEAGMYEGYIAADPRLERVENPRCLCKGDADGCVHRFVFRPEADPGR